MENVPVFTGEVPSRLKKLQKTERGYPVPWFVAWMDGKPDFRAMDGEKFVQAVRYKLCWICGEPMGKFKAFVIGPMCAVNRTSSEPPSHRDCAVFAAMACPFLANPDRCRRETNLPEHKDPAGLALSRNPGVALVWITKEYQIYPVNANGDIKAGWLFEIGDPEETLWFARGREATREEVMKSFETGIPALQKVATEESPEAEAKLQEQYDRAMTLVPA